MHDLFMMKAYEQANKSSCTRTKVGVVIVKDREIIAQGYNNTAGGIKDCRNIGCIRDILHIKHGERREVCRALCAEQIAISEAARNGILLDGSTVYVTSAPCHICAKLLVSAGVKEIIYDKEYADEFRDMFLKESGVPMYKLDELKISEK